MTVAEQKEEQKVVCHSCGQPIVKHEHKGLPPVSGLDAPEYMHMTGDAALDVKLDTEHAAIPFDREPSAFDHAPDGLREIAGWMEHVVEHHHGDTGACAPKLNLPVVAADLRSWADRIEEGSGWKKRIMGPLMTIGENYDYLVLVPIGLVAMFTSGPASAGMLFALAAWHRISQVFTVGMRVKREQMEREEQVQAIPLPLSALMGGRPIHLGEKHTDPDLPQPGQYL